MYIFIFKNCTLFNKDSDAYIQTYITIQVSNLLLFHENMHCVLLYLMTPTVVVFAVLIWKLTVLLHIAALSLSGFMLAQM